MMSRDRLRAALAVALTVITVACGGATDETTVPSGPSFPSVAVDEWLDALVGGDAVEASARVEPIGVSLILGIENDLSDDELAELLESGWTSELQRSFWSSFSADFAVFAGGPLDELVVGRHTDLATPSGRFALVRIEQGAGGGSVVTRAAPDGTWAVDLLATLGGAFAPLLFERLTDVDPADPAGTLILGAMRTTGLESLEAGTTADPDDARLATELERIRRLVDR